MIYVSHRLDEIFQIADRVAVLRDGAMVGVRSIDHTTPEELVQKIVGRKTRETVKATDASRGDAVLSLRNFEVGRVGRWISICRTKRGFGSRRPARGRARGNLARPCSACCPSTER